MKIVFYSNDIALEKEFVFYTVKDLFANKNLQIIAGIDLFCHVYKLTKILSHYL